MKIVGIIEEHVRLHNKTPKNRFAPVIWGL